MIGDDNIDTLNDNNNHYKHKDKDIKDIRDDFKINNNLSTHNHKATSNRANHNSSIDYIYSNCPAKVNNINTYNNIFSDHKIISCQYSNNNLLFKPTYLIKRDYSLLTKYNQEQY